MNTLYPHHSAGHAWL